jgi:DNA-binding response OmpR family regulator
MGSRVLVADDDLWILRMISTVLERRGHAVTLAADGQEALERALREPPDLVITDIHMPRLDGWGLITALREDPRLADIPVIALTEDADEDSRVRGYRLGIEDYVTKPFRFDELDLRVARLLRRAPGPQAAASAVPRAITETGSIATVGLVGTLDQVSLPSLLTLLELDRKTGILHLVRENDGNGEENAQLVISRGRIIAATLDRGEALSDAERVYQLLLWDTGRFELNQQDVETEDRIGMSTTALLLEGMRRIDEENR